MHRTIRFAVDAYAGLVAVAVTGLDDSRRAFMRWIYQSLEQEYEYLMSDDSVDDMLRANDYTFTADGRRFG